MMVAEDWNIEKIENKIREIKKNAIGQELLSNYIPTKVISAKELRVWYNDNGIVILIKNPYNEEAFFVANKETALVELLEKLPSKTMIESLYQDEDFLLPVCEKAGFRLYSTFERKILTYEKNPYSIREKGKRGLLQEYYDSGCGEYATEEDVEQLDTIHRRAFDVYGDDFFSIDEWKQIIQNKECMVYKENDIILSYYVWRVEGKKLYSNVSYNSTTANILYNMERRVFENCWERGIRILYFWIKREDVRAMKRIRSKPVEGEKIGKPLYNDIIVKL